MLQHTSSEVTVHGSNNKIQTANSEDVCWSVRKVKLKVLFFSRCGFFPICFSLQFLPFACYTYFLSNWNGQRARVFPSCWFQEKTYLTALQAQYKCALVQYKLSRFLNCQLITTELYLINGHQTTQFLPKYLMKLCICSTLLVHPEGNMSLFKFTRGGLVLFSRKF